MLISVIGDVSTWDQFDKEGVHGKKKNVRAELTYYQWIMKEISFVRYNIRSMFGFSVEVLN